MTLSFSVGSLLVRNIHIMMIYVLCLRWVALLSTSVSSHSRLTALGFSVGSLLVRNICITMIYVLCMRYVALSFTSTSSGSGPQLMTFGFSVGSLLVRKICVMMIYVLCREDSILSENCNVVRLVYLYICPDYLHLQICHSSPHPNAKY